MLRHKQPINTLIKYLTWGLGATRVRWGKTGYRENGKSLKNSEHQLIPAVIFVIACEKTTPSLKLIFIRSGDSL